MKKEIADKWVAALRSGEYKQAKHVLDRGDSQCCLGVLCRILGKEGTETEKNDKYVLAYEDETEVLPDSVVEEAGMHSKQGYYKWDISDIGTRYCRYMLAEQNDSGLTFKEIADIIEQHYEEL